MISKCSIAATAAALTLTIVFAPVRSKAVDDGVNQRFEQIFTDCKNEWGFSAGTASCILEKEKEYGNELERLYQRVLKVQTINGPIPPCHSAPSCACVQRLAGRPECGILHLAARGTR